MVDLFHKIIDCGMQMGIRHIDAVAFEGQVAEVEHICHELGHAISLRLMSVGDGCLSYAWGSSKLPDAIDKKLMTLDDPDENEALEKRCGSTESERLGCALLRAIRFMIRTA